jgi:hypothetical protein
VTTQDPTLRQSRDTFGGGAENLHAQIREVMGGGAKTKIYCKVTIGRRCVLAALLTVKLGLTKFGNQANPLKYSEEKKILFLTNLEQMFKRTSTELDTQQTTTHQRLTCALKNAWWLLPQGYGK